MKFKLETTDQGSKARAGLITTDHGKIKTPVFAPVGTLGAVKGIHRRELETDLDQELILGNAYHLYLRPKFVVYGYQSNVASIVCPQMLKKNRVSDSVLKLYSTTQTLCIRCAGQKRQHQHIQIESSLNFQSLC